MTAATTTTTTTTTTTSTNSNAGRTVWNSLPDELKDPAHGSDSFTCKQFLNTILFSFYEYDQHIGGFLKRYALYKFTFYLLKNLLTKLLNKSRNNTQ